MNTLVACLWMGNVFCDTLGQIAFKKAATTPDSGEGLRHYWIGLFRRPWLWAGLLAYVFEFLLWLAFLSVVPLSEGILLGSVNIVAVMLVGRILFHERLTGLRVAGMLLVSCGVAVVGAF